MIIISKSMLALSALVSAGLVAAVDMSGRSTVDRAAAVQVAERFPVTSEMFTPVSMTQFAAQMFRAPAGRRRQQGRQAAGRPSSAAEQDWPYISQQCLVSADGSPVRKVNRVITIERRVGDNTSELMRVPVADIAQR